MERVNGSWLGKHVRVWVRGTGEKISLQNASKSQLSPALSLVVRKKCAPPRAICELLHFSFMPDCPAPSLFWLAYFFSSSLLFWGNRSGVAQSAEYSTGNLFPFRGEAGGIPAFWAVCSQLPGPRAQWEPSAPSLHQKSAFLGAEGQEREAACLSHRFIICDHSIPAWWEGTYHVRFQARVLLSALPGLNLHSSTVPVWVWASCVTSLPQLLSEKMMGTKWDNLVTRQSTRLGFQ